MAEPTLYLLPTDFARCQCGHRRVEHEEDRVNHATGRCPRCPCKRFTAVTEFDRRTRN